MKKKCAKCKKLLELSQFNKQKKSPDGLQYYCKSCLREVGRKWDRENREDGNKGSREIKKRLKLRMGALEAYGMKCTCCGESELKFLAIDHINGGGRKHRKEIGGNFYQWLKINKYPAGFQTHCHNCNQAKGYYGECPHKRIRDGNEG